MKKIIFIFMTVLLMASITATAITAIWSRDRPQILLDNNSLTITQEGGRIVIYDVLSDESYTFILKHTKPLEGDVEPIRVISNEHIVIDKYPKRLLITDLTAKRSYTISISILRVKVNSAGQFEEIKDREVTQ